MCEGGRLSSVDVVDVESVFTLPRSDTEPQRGWAHPEAGG